MDKCQKLRKVVTEQITAATAAKHCFHHPSSSKQYRLPQSPMLVHLNGRLGSKPADRLQDWMYSLICQRLTVYLILTHSEVNSHKTNTHEKMLFATLAARLHHKKLFSSLPSFSKSHSNIIGLCKHCWHHFHNIYPNVCNYKKKTLHTTSSVQHPRRWPQIQKRHFKVLTDTSLAHLPIFSPLYSSVSWIKTISAMQISVLWIPSPFWRGSQHCMTPGCATPADSITPRPQMLARMIQN